MTDLTIPDKELGNNHYDILIVDDSIYIINLITHIIRIKGFRCKAVKNIIEAEKELKKSSPKLIFLDVNLPDSNGYEFCKVLRSNEKHCNILLYYFTGVSESRNRN